MNKNIIKVLLICLLIIVIVGYILVNSKISKQEINTKETIADLVVLGTIYTAEEKDNSLAQAFAIKDGKYIYVGDKEGVKKFIEEGKTEIIDKTSEGLIIPGCTEGHSHYFGIYGVGLQFPCNNCSYEEMLKILKEQVETKNINQFVTYGWNTYELVEKREAGFNFAEEIENIAPGIPVVLIDNSGHSAVCNITALEKAGLLSNPEVRGGKVYLDKNGKPSGYVGDQVVGYVIEKTIDKPLSDEQFKIACETAINTLLKRGYTNALDAYTNHFDSLSVYKALKEMDDAGQLTMNVASCYNIKSYDADIYQSRVNEVANIVNNYSSTHFNPGYIKLFADGVVESGTGWIFDKYNHAEEGKEHGNIIWTQDELNSIVQYANSKNILIHTHSYGDAACRAMIDAYIYSNNSNNNKYRNCLAHVRNIQNEDIIKAANNKIPIAANLIWHYDYNDNIPEEKEIKEKLVRTMGEKLYYSGYPIKSLIDNGVVISSSTDAPAAESIEGNIMNVLEVSVTGMSPGSDGKPFAKEECLSVREGLKALTINGAWQLGLEEQRGSIKVGKYADFVVLDKNIINYEGEQLRTIHDVKILNTYFEGKNVYTVQ